MLSKVLPFSSLSMVSCDNFVSKGTIFETFVFKRTVWPWNSG